MHAEVQYPTHIDTSWTLIGVIKLTKSKGGMGHWRGLEQGRKYTLQSLAQDRLDDLPMNIGQPKVTALVAEG